MYLPATVAAMATETLSDAIFTLNPEVTSSTASSIDVRWNNQELPQGYARGFRVRYHRLASTYVQESGLLPPRTQAYGIENLVADTYYKVCVAMYRNDTNLPMNECVDASTTSWHIPVSIGSSIGAVLALSIIVLIVLLSRCPNMVRQTRTAALESSKYDSMSYPDDRYEMSDTTTHCHDQDKDDEEIFSHHSEGDSLTGSKGIYKHAHYHHSPQSLAERVCNGSRMPNGVGKHTSRVPLARCGRTLSLTDRRHQTSHTHRARQARLAHIHANFHSIQSEPGNIPTRAAPPVSITDFPASSNTEFASSRKSHHCSMPSTTTTNTNTNIITSKGQVVQCSGCNSKPAGYKDTPRLMYRIESATSDPTVADSSVGERRAKPPALKNIPKTIHMSIEGDTMV